MRLFAAHLSVFESEIILTFPDHLVAPASLDNLLERFIEQDEVADACFSGRWGIKIEFNTEDSHNLVLVAEVLQAFREREP